MSLFSESPHELKSLIARLLPHPRLPADTTDADSAEIKRSIAKHAVGKLDNDKATLAYLKSIVFAPNRIDIRTQSAFKAERDLLFESGLESCDEDVDAVRIRGKERRQKPIICKKDLPLANRDAINVESDLSRYAKDVKRTIVAADLVEDKGGRTMVSEIEKGMEEELSLRDIWLSDRREKKIFTLLDTLPNDWSNDWLEDHTCLASNPEKVVSPPDDQSFDLDPQPLSNPTISPRRAIDARSTNKIDHNLSAAEDDRAEIGCEKVHSFDTDNPIANIQSPEEDVTKIVPVNASRSKVDDVKQRKKTRNTSSQSLKFDLAPANDLVLKVTPRRRMFREEHEDSIRSIKLPIARMRQHYISGRSTLDKKLSWVPFPPELAHVDPSDGYHAAPGVEASLNSFLHVEQVRVAQLLDRDYDINIRYEGLVTEDDLDDECRTGMSNQNFEQMDSLVKKRKHQMYGFQDAMRQMPPPKSRRSTQDLMRHYDERSPFTNALSLFLGLQGRAPSSSVAAQTQPWKNEDSRPTDKTDERHTSNPTSDSALVQPRSRPPRQLSLPSISVSETFMTQHKLIRALSRLAPALELNTHDISLQEPHTADIILASSSAIIVTDMQRVRQLRLPGSKSQFTPFEERVVATARRFEKLGILINIGLTGIQTDDHVAMEKIQRLSGRYVSEIVTHTVSDEVEDIADEILNLIEKMV